MRFERHSNKSTLYSISIALYPWRVKLETRKLRNCGVCVCVWGRYGRLACVSAYHWSKARTLLKLSEADCGSWIVSVYIYTGVFPFNVLEGCI